MADFDIVKTSGGYFHKRRIVRLYRTKRLPLMLSEAVMVGRDPRRAHQKLAGVFPRSLARARIPAATTIAERRLRYWVKDLRSAWASIARLSVDGGSNSPPPPL